MNSLTYADREADRTAATQKTTGFTTAKAAITAFLASDAVTDTVGTQVTVTNNKRIMDEVIAWFEGKNSTYATLFTSVPDTTFEASYKMKKAAVDALQKKVDNAKKIDGIRQEQVNALETRDAANFHTSWMGLTRPLKEESRTGLAVAAGAFALIAIVMTLYIFRTSSAPDFSFFRGGFRARQFVRSFV